MNKVSLTGRIANDLDLRKTKSNLSILSLNLAVRSNRKDDKGEYKTDFIRVRVWQQSAEYLNSYAGKGVLIGVSGRIETDSYEKNGTTVYETYVVAEQVEILNKPDSSKMGGKVDYSNVTDDSNFVSEETPW